MINLLSFKPPISFIQGLLSDMDEPAASASNANTPAAASASVSNSNSKVIVSGGKREWVPSKERLQQQAQQQQQQQPSKPERRSEDSYSSSSPKSNDWFDDRDSYDAFSNTGSSSSPSSSRSSRSTSNSKVEADRLDSERILNELLMDLDSSSRVGSSDSDSGIDYFDFSVDSDDVRSPSKARDAPSRAMTKAAPASSARTVAPKMEDFASFEQYLDALVSHEKTSTSGGGGTSWDNSKKGVSAGRDFDSRGGSAGRDVDGLDDSLLAFLGGDDEDNVTRGSRSPQNSQNTRKISTGSERANEAPKVRSWNPQPSKPDSRVEATESIDDLDSFLDSLEASNVLPSKMKVANLVEKKIEKVSVKSSPVAAESIVESASPHTDYAVYTVKDLKDKLRERGLPVSGSKAELVTRLNKAN